LEEFDDLLRGVVFADFDEVYIVGQEVFLEFGCAVSLESGDYFLEIPQLEYPLTFGLVKFIWRDVDKWGVFKYFDKDEAVAEVGVADVFVGLEGGEGVTEGFNC
jgi:hypothetical protein